MKYLRDVYENQQAEITCGQDNSQKKSDLYLQNPQNGRGGPPPVFFPRWVHIVKNFFFTKMCILQLFIIKKYRWTILRIVKLKDAKTFGGGSKRPPPRHPRVKWEVGNVKIIKWEVGTVPPPSGPSCMLSAVCVHIGNIVNTNQ